MASLPEKRNPAGGRGLGDAQTNRLGLQSNFSPTEVLLQRLPHPARKCGVGWRARCPACEDRKGALSFRDGDDGKLLLYCFRGCLPDAVLAALGLRWADVQPPRYWPESPEERRRARRAIREMGWSAALSVVALEAKVALIAAGQLSRQWYLSAEDDARLAEAVERLDRAAAMLIKASQWRPEVAR